MKKVSVGIFLFLFCPKIYSINVEKLFLSTVSIKNQSDNNANLSIHLKKLCNVCEEPFSQQTELVVERNATHTLALDAGQILTSIASPNSVIDYEIAYDNIKNVTLLDHAKNTPLIHKMDIKQSLSEDVALDNLISYLKQQPLTHQKNLRGLDIANISVHDFYQKIITTYNNNFSSTVQSFDRRKTKIPCTIHKIWFGSQMPLLYQKKIKQWKKLHPGWKVIHWSEELLQQHFPEGFYNQQMFLEAKQKRNYAKMADVARYEIVEKFGGLYVDIDFDCLEQFEQLHHSYDFYGSLEHPFITSGGCINGIFGAKAHHPILQQCLKNIKNYETNPPSLHYCANHIEEELDKAWMFTGPGLISRSIFEAINQKDNIDIVLPYQYFIPTDRFMRKKIYPISLCYHDYNTSSHPEQHWTLALLRKAFH